MSVFIPNIRISIGTFVLHSVTSCVVESTWEQLTDTCKIQVPKSIVVPGGKTLAEVITTGMPVKVEAGYNGNYQLEFEGYVSRSLSPNIPVEINCENEMWKLKQSKLNKSFKAATLMDIVRYCAPGYKVEGRDFNIGNYRIVNSTAAQVFEQLKEYGQRIFFRGKTLVVGLVYESSDLKSLPTELLHFQRNVDLKGSQLEYRLKSDVKLNVKATSILPNNKKVEVEVGDKSGEARTLTYYNLDKDALTKIANAELSKLQVDGYSGTVKLFGEPYVRHGQKVELVDEQFEERKSKYYIDKTVFEFGLNGIRRVSKIGWKA